VYGDCDRARRWASAELDGELSEFEHSLLESHVAGCPSCNEFRAAIAGVTGAIRATSLEPFQGIVEVRRIRRRARGRLAPAVAAMAVAAVGLGSLLASSDVRPGSEVNARAPSDGQAVIVNPGSSLTNGPTNLHLQTGRQAVPSVSTVDTRLAQRPVRGGPVQS
jgi:hypothetical protein